ncbi:MAG: glycosyltransferase [Anaerolineae bacterium]|nr:glycosyltransferase [Anaerolineae bacterium]
MRIGILIPGFSASEADWSIPVYLNLVRELARSHDVRVFPIRYPFTREPYQVYGAKVFPFGGGSYTSGLQRWRLIREVEKSLIQHHQTLPFDVLHAIWADETGYIANRVGKKMGIPRVVSIAGGELVGFPEIHYGLQLGRFTSWLVYHAVKSATRLIVPCLYTEQLLSAYMGSQERIRLVPLGVDTTLFTLSEQERRSLEFLHVASLSPVKRQDILLHLFTKLPNAHLHIVGDGALRENLKQLAVDLGIAERVIFYGEVAHDRLSEYYQQAEFLVMTSQHEAFCMAAVEAAACGTMVFGSSVGVLPEIGMTVPFGDVDGLAERIIARRRTSTEQRRIQLRWHVEQAYSLDQMVQGITRVYEEIT